MKRPSRKPTTSQSTTTTTTTTTLKQSQNGFYRKRRKRTKQRSIYKVIKQNSTLVLRLVLALCSIGIVILFVSRHNHNHHNKNEMDGLERLNRVNPKFFTRQDKEEQDSVNRKQDEQKEADQPQHDNDEKEEERITPSNNKFNHGGMNHEKHNPFPSGTVHETDTWYKSLRLEMDPIFQNNHIQRKELAAKLRKRSYKSIMGEVKCPLYPPEGYPDAWNILDIISNWNPDDTTPRDAIYQGICVFDFDTEYDKAINYRNAEVPYILRDHPDTLQTVERWNSPDYLSKVLEEPGAQKVEYSANNHFMYWNMHSSNNLNKPNNNDNKKKHLKPNKKDKPEGWTQPTKYVKMTYDEWNQKANQEESMLNTDKEHWYFRINASSGGMHRFLYEEVPMFQPIPSAFVVNEEKTMGINCRFGMKGVIAENHFDGSRNMIALFGGERRYILTHPDQCQDLALYPRDHPSGRHSAVDWSDPDLNQYPQFKNVKANEIVLQAGDVLYLPTHWFHFIVSLETNYQCNMRSGVSHEYDDFITDCGFPVKK